MDASVLVYYGNSKEDAINARQHGIGGSDAGAVMGVNPFKSSYDVWVSRVTPGLHDTPGESAYWGNRLEDVLAQEFALRQRRGVYHWPVVLQSNRVPCMLASVDRFLTTPTDAPGTSYWGTSSINHQMTEILEIKTRAKSRISEWANGVEPVTWWQVQHYLAVTGLDKGWVCVLFGGQEFKIYEVPRDNASIEKLEVACAKLWGHVQSNIPPIVECTAPKGSPQTKLMLSTSQVEIVSDYILAIKNRQYAQEQCEKLRNDLLKVLNGADVGITSNGEPLFRVYRSNVNYIDTELLREELPEVAAQYSRIREVQRLWLT